MDSIWFEINICFKCGEYLMTSYNKNIQTPCSIPLCNCDIDNTTSDLYLPYGNYEDIDSDVEFYYDSQDEDDINYWSGSDPD